MPSSTSFNHETVYLDGETFSDCEFRDSRLIFSGGEAPTFRNCKIVDCEWKFEGAAEQTLAHLKAMWNAGGKAPVQALIKDVTGGGR